jgi:hypothetical protein
MAEKLIKVHAVFVVALQESQKQLTQRSRGLPGDGRDQCLVLLVEQAQVLRAAGLERGLPRQTLVNNGPDAPEISLPVIVLGHDDFRGHVHRRAAERGRHHVGL